MKPTGTTKYILKVWSTTLLLGTFLVMSYLYFFTHLTSDINNVLDLYVRAFVSTLFFGVITSPVALVFYTVSKIIFIKVSNETVIKFLLALFGSALIFLFFVLAFGQDPTLLWNKTPLVAFFNCYTFTLVTFVFVYKLDRDEITSGKPSGS